MTSRIDIIGLNGNNGEHYYHNTPEETSRAELAQLLIDAHALCDRAEEIIKHIGDHDDILRDAT